MNLNIYINKKYIYHNIYTIIIIIIVIILVCKKEVFIQGVLFMYFKQLNFKHLLLNGELRVLRTRRRRSKQKDDTNQKCSPCRVTQSNL